MEKTKPIGRAVGFAVLALAVMMLVGGSYAAWSYFDAPPLDRYRPVLAQMSAHKFDACKGGCIDLSKAFPGLTPKDFAYIQWRDDGSFLAMFPTYFGEGAQLAGLLYTSRPLDDQDTRHRDGPSNFSQRLIGVSTYGNLVLEKQINPSWYHVSYKLH